MMYYTSVCHKVFLLLMVVGLLSFPLIVQAAEDGDPDGTQLKAILEKSEAIKNFKEGQQNDDMIDKWMAIFCEVELQTLPGTIIWEYRRVHDHCPKKEQNVRSYCFQYSRHCDHYRWDPDCRSETNTCPE